MRFEKALAVPPKVGGGKRWAGVTSLSCVYLPPVLCPIASYTPLTSAHPILLQGSRTLHAVCLTPHFNHSLTA